MAETQQYLQSRDDTIVAISTPLGAAPRGVIRLSGSQCLKIVTSLVLRAGQPVDLSDLRWGARRANLLLDRGAAVAVDIWLMRGPHSYTGEDVVELHLPGSPALLDLTIERCRQLGARPALPGEFTERAFLNGRMDLSQAEAVAAMIHAESEAERQAAWSVLEGRASARINELAETIKQLLAQLELDFDFSDQDIQIVAPEHLERDIRALGAQVDAELERRRDLPRATGSQRILLLGAVNAGKSSLFNALQADQTAIVSDAAGTTRDFLEAHLILGERQFVLIDSAGEGFEAHEVDRLAHQLRKREQGRADAHLEVIDGRQLGPSFRPRLGALLTVATHADLVPEDERRNWPVTWVSTKTGAGLAELKELLSAQLRAQGRGALVHLAARHARLLSQTKDSLDRALAATEAGLGEELIACDLQDALWPLREITGADYSDEVLTAIMRDFCIGK